uniref:Uncharacterized protein n=1 Tax=Spongospora subterranea TaxID=70186 RepID=A0A0H5RD39_9EUKA|eukprot:CRZ11517.1 hypothetical protein [Spongospora subterranea]
MTSMAESSPNRLDVLLSKPLRRPNARKMAKTMAAASLPLLKNIPNLGRKKPRSDGQADYETMEEEIRTLKAQVSVLTRGQRHLRNTVQMKDAKLIQKQHEIEGFLSKENGPISVNMKAKLLHQMGHVQAYKEKVKQLRNELEESHKQLAGLRHKCRFSQLEELRIQVEEFYAEVLRLRGKRLGDVDMAVGAVKTLEKDLRVHCSAVNLRKQLSELKGRDGLLSEELENNLSYLLNERRRLLHEQDVNFLSDRDLFARNFRLAKSLISQIAKK